jgi:hypothetical protein
MKSGIRGPTILDRLGTRSFRRLTGSHTLGLACYSLNPADLILGAAARLGTAFTSSHTLIVPIPEVAWSAASR